MLFFARGHNFTSDTWLYQGTALRLNDTRAVRSRLRQIYESNIIRGCRISDMRPTDMLYARLKRAISTWGRRGLLYVECALLVRDGNVVSEIAFGNAIFGNAVVGITNNNKAGGFLMFGDKDATFIGTCSFDMGSSNIEGSFNDGLFSWSRTEPRSTMEQPVGDVCLKGLHSCNQLRLVFSSRVQEQGWQTPHVRIEKEGVSVGKILRSINPIFAKGYRFKLWLQDEIPVFYWNNGSLPNQEMWLPVMTAIFGTWFCYKPIAFD